MNSLYAFALYVYSSGDRIPNKLVIEFPPSIPTSQRLEAVHNRQDDHLEF